MLYRQNICFFKAHKLPEIINLNVMMKGHVWEVIAGRILLWNLVEKHKAKLAIGLLTLTSL